MKARLSKRLRAAAGLVALGMSGWFVSPAAFADERLAFTCKQLAPEATEKLSLQTGSFAKPDYPKWLARADITGNVVASFGVDGDGRVTDVEVLASADAEFERVVVHSLLGARSDATKLTVEQRNQRSCLDVGFRLLTGGTGGGVFSLPVEASSTYGAFSLPSRASENLPERFKYDEPPKIRIAAGLVFPRSLAVAGMAGSATVTFVVDRNGRVSQTRVDSATHPEFGEAAAASMRAWRFEPARRAGQPTASLFVRKIDFKSASELSDEDRAIRATLHDEQPNIYSSKDLDAAPVALYRVFPDYRPKSKDAGPVSLTIDVVLDEEGYVHFPVVAEGEVDALAWDAMTALLRWQFSPPTRAGKPVRAYVRVPLLFVAPADQ